MDIAARRIGGGNHQHRARRAERDIRINWRGGQIRSPDEFEGPTLAAQRVTIPGRLRPGQFGQFRVLGVNPHPDRMTDGPWQVVPE